MPFFGISNAARSASNWHENVTGLVGHARPATSPLPGDDFGLFPYAQLQVFTKGYLGKKKRTEGEQDELLLDLIQKHDCKEVAFAACATHLSIGAVQHTLETAFAVDHHTFDGLESYLHAFVAACQCQPSLELIQDRNFAVSLATVVRAVSSHGVTPRAVEDLITAWSLGHPVDKLLLVRARALTNTVFHHVETDLTAFKTQLRLGTVNRSLCDRVIGYSAALSTAHELDDSATACISCRQGWISWRPNVDRLRSWCDVTNGTVFGCLAELEGPDLNADGQNDGSVWQALIRRGQFLNWLESQGFRRGAGLTPGDSQQLLISFFNFFMECVISSLKRQRPMLLQYLIKENGLDTHTLRSWLAAETLLQPRFLTLLLPRSQSDPGDMDEIVVQGLSALANDFSHAVRRPLGKRIVACVCHALTKLESTFQHVVTAGEDWAPSAGRLWTLRSSIAASGWLHSMLNTLTVSKCTSQPPQHSLSTLLALRKALNDIGSGTGRTLQKCFEVYAKSFVLQGTAVTIETTTIPHALHSAWLYVQRQSFRDVAIRIALLDALDVAHRSDCIKKLQGASDDTVHKLLNSLVGLSQGDVLEFENLAIAISTLEASSCGTDHCWRALFICVAKAADARINRSEFTSSGYSIYCQLVETTHSISAGDLDLVESTHSWLQKLRFAEPLFTLLEAEDGSHRPIHHILIEQRPAIQKQYLSMLLCFLQQTDKERITLMQELILALRETNSAQVSQAVLAISKVGVKGFAQCQKLLIFCREDKNLASARLAVALRMPGLSDATRTALISLGQILNLGLDHELKPPANVIEAARKDYAKRVAVLVARAQQLERSRMSLKRTDADGIKAMVAELALEEAPSVVASLIAALPKNLTGFINEVGDDEVDLRFALSKQLSASEHLAFGLKGTETLTVHLQLNTEGKFDGLCVHLQNCGDRPIQAHKYYTSKFAPDRLHCRGRLTRLTYVVARNLWRAIHEQGETSLCVLYNGIRDLMQTSVNRCIVCAGSLGAQLHRGTLCTSPGCKQAYLKSPLDLRLQDVRSNGRVVDLLLTSVFAAANLKALNFLPDHPAQLNDAAKLQILLNSLPPTKTLAAAADFKTGLRGCGDRAEVLLSWLCTSYRGFVVPATGAYQLPNISKIHQFLVVDNPPEVEAAFAQHNYLKDRHVLFHGTSIDRLYGILTQGIKVCSNTDLQKHGAARGVGIYTGREPETAWGYAACTQANANFNGFYNSRADFRDSSIVLGLEHAGNDTGGNRRSGVHVIKDATILIVRYILVVPPNVNSPKASDIAPTMLKTFHSLRASAAAASAPDAGGFLWDAANCSVM